MKRIFRIFSTLLTLAVLLALVGGAVLGVVEGFRWLWPSLTQLSDQVLAALVAASGTVLTAVATVLYSQKRAKDREIAEAHRASKVEIYQGFMEMLFDLLNATRKSQLADELGEEWVERIMILKRDLIVWGSPGIIRAWTKFEKQTESLSTRERIYLMGDILKEIRKDLGNSNWPMQRGDLVQMFIADDLENSRL